MPVDIPSIIAQRRENLEATMLATVDRQQDDITTPTGKANLAIPDLTYLAWYLIEFLLGNIGGGGGPGGGMTLAQFEASVAMANVVSDLANILIDTGSIDTKLDTTNGTLASVQANTAITNSALADLQSRAVTPAVTVVTGAGSVAAGAAKVSFGVTGAANATVLGQSLEPGTVIDLGDWGSVLPALAYDATGSELLIVTETEA